MLDAARNGTLSVLSIFGADPLLHAPDAAAVRAAFERLSFLVVSDLFLTETARAADLVLPAKGAFEKNGTTLNLAGDLLPVNASLEAPDGVISDLEMLVGLAQQFDLPLPSAEELDATVIARVAHPPQGFGLGDERFATHDAHAEPLSGDGLTVRVTSDIFAGGGTAVHDQRIAALRPLARASLCAADAASSGVRDGDTIDLEGDAGTLHALIVTIDPAVEPGTVVVIDGLPEAPANLLGARARVVKTHAQAAAVQA
jgi:predicted molibdopterin-dependent oxidoreductase YjgC